jgi:hypothetical protein
MPGGDPDRFLGTSGWDDLIFGRESAAFQLAKHMIRFSDQN